MPTNKGETNMKIKGWIDKHPAEIVIASMWLTVIIGFTAYLIYN